MTLQLPLATAELERWRGDGLILPLWWRDDDAIRPTPALDRLLALAAKFAAPIHIAVIPEPATPELAERLNATGEAYVFVHGWKHVNHAPAGEKRAEVGAHRDIAVILEEITAGRRRLKDLFRERALPVFTPPWNRVAPDVGSELAAAGFAALSTFTPRAKKFAAPGLLQVNTHLDPVAWRNGGGLLDLSLLDVQLARELEDRRKGKADSAEPYGILTHHLVMNEATWAFMERLLDMLASSGVFRWTPPLYEIT